MGHVLSAVKRGGVGEGICFSCKQQENETGVALKTMSVACAGSIATWTDRSDLKREPRTFVFLLEPLVERWGSPLARINKEELGRSLKLHYKTRI